MRADSLVSDVIPQSFRNPFRDENNLLLPATFGLQKNDLDPINVCWSEFENLTDAHSATCQELENESIPHKLGGIDNFVYCLPVDDINGTNSRRTKYVSYYSIITGILEGELITVDDVVKKGSKDGTPGVLGALFFPFGKGSEE